MTPPRREDSRERAEKVIVDALYDNTVAGTIGNPPGFFAEAFLDYLDANPAARVALGRYLMPNGRVAAEPASESRQPHQPGESHRYRLECDDCGQQGTIRLTIDPEYAATREPEQEEERP